jgi:hypothetical protein
MGSAISVVLSPAKRVWTIIWWRIPDSNRGPADYDARTALSAMFGVYRIAVEVDGYYCVIPQAGRWGHRVKRLAATPVTPDPRASGVIARKANPRPVEKGAKFNMENQVYKLYKLDPRAASLPIKVSLYRL